MNVDSKEYVKARVSKENPKSPAEKFVYSIAEVLIPAVSDSVTDLSFMYKLDDMKEFRKKLGALCEAVLEEIDNQIKETELIDC